MSTAQCVAGALVAGLRSILPDPGGPLLGWDEAAALGCLPVLAGMSWDAVSLSRRWRGSGGGALT